MTSRVKSSTEKSAALKVSTPEKKPVAAPATPPAPEKNRALPQETTGFETGGKRRSGDDAKLGRDTTPNKGEVEAQHRAQREFEALAKTHGDALAKAGIDDGASLRAFGRRIARELSGNPARATDPALDELQGKIDPEAFAKIVRAAGRADGGETAVVLNNDSVANALAQGKKSSVIDFVKELPKDAAEKLAKLGLTFDDLKALAPAGPHALEAVKKLVAGDLSEALAALKKVGSAALPLVEKSLKHFASKMDDGLAKDILTNEKVLHELLSGWTTHRALESLVKGDVVDAFTEISKNKTLREAVTGEIAQQPKIKKGLDALGLSASDLKGASDALPRLLEALQAAQDGDTAKALAKLEQAGAQGLPLLEKSLRHFSERLPDGIAKELLTDKKFVRELIRGDTSGDALRAILKGNGAGAVRALSGNKDLRDRAVEIVAKDPKVKAGMEKLGLSVDDLKVGADALPNLLDAAAAAAKGDWTGALEHLGEAGPSAKRAAEKAILNVAKKLPDGTVKDLLTNPDIVRGLVGDPKLHDAFKKLVKGKVTEAVEALNSTPVLRDQMLAVIGADPKVAAALAKIGLSAADLPQASDALPSLLKAAASIDKGEFANAIGHLRDAAQVAPELAEKAILNVGSKLPAGIAKDLFTNKELVADLVRNTGTHDAMVSLAQGRIAEGLKALSSNPAIRNGVIDALSKSPAMKAGLEKIGLTGEDLKASGDAFPLLIEAAELAKNGKTGDALSKLFEAAQTSAPTIAKSIAHLARNLPAGVGRDILQDQALVAELIRSGKDVKAILGSLKNGDVSGALGKLAASPALLNSVVDSLVKIPSVKNGLASVGLTGADVKAHAAALPELWKAVESVAKGDLGKAFDHLGGVARANPELVTKVVGFLGAKLPQTGAAGIARGVLTDPELVQELLLNKDAHASLKAMLKGDLVNGLEGLAGNVALRDEVIEHIAEKPKTAKALADLGISVDELKAAGAAVPRLLEGVELLASGKVKEGLTELLKAGKDVPPEVLTGIINKVAAKLPDSGAGGVAKAILTDAALVGQLIADPAVHASIGELAGGDIAKGLKGLAANENLRLAVGNLLAKNQNVLAALEPFGITSGADIAEVIEALPKLVEVAGDIKDRKIGEAFKDLGSAITNIDPQLRARMLGKLADKLGLPDFAEDMLVASAGMLGDPEIMAAFGDAFDAFKSKDPREFVEQLANLGETIAKESPEAAKAFLNSLGHLPGGLGKFFSDRELNAILVDSGSVEAIFGAAEELAQGDIGGALKKIGEALGDLIGAGENIKIAGKDTHIGKDGLKAMGLIFERFIDAMPEKLKKELLERAAKVTAKAGLGSIPILGDAVNIGSSAKDLYDAIKDGDGLDIVLASADLALSAAGAFQVFKPFTQPLKIALGVGKAVKDVVGLVQDVREFGEDFTGMAA